MSMWFVCFAIGSFILSLHATPAEFHVPEGLDEEKRETIIHISLRRPSAKNLFELVAIYKLLKH